MKKFLALAALVSVSATPSFAQTVATWTFETTSGSITGTSATITGINADVGSGTASGVHASSATAWSSPAGNGSSHSFSSTAWAPGDYYQYQFSTVGFSGLSLSWDQTSSSTGPKNYTLSYSLDGSSFTTITPYSPLVNGAPNTAWSASTPQSIFSFNQNLGSLIDNSPNVYLRFTVADTASEGGNSGVILNTGTDRMDNVSVFTTPVPEPSTFAIGIVGGLAALAVWKRKK